MLNPETFCLIIEQFVRKNPDVSYFDAIHHYCEKNQVEYESIPRLLTNDLKQKLRKEAIHRNLLTIKKADVPPEIPLD